jgi:hypothetical protein
MKDALFLLVCALLVAVISWGFWHYADGAGFEILASIAMLALLAENLRLRRELRKRSA